MDSPNEDRTASFGGYRYLESRRCLLAPNGADVPLRAKSYAVFKYLAERADTVVSKDDLFSAVWANVSVTDDSLVQCVTEIRRAIGDSDRQVLRTVLRQGYLLASDVDATQNGQQSASAESATPDAMSPTSLWSKPLVKVAALVSLALLLSVGFFLPGDPVTLATVSPSEGGRPTVSIVLQREAGNPGNTYLDALATELRVALSRYRSVRLLEPDVVTDYQIQLTANQSQSGSERVVVNTIDTATSEVLYANSFDVSGDAIPADRLAARIAAFASPSGGSLWRHLIATSKSTPVEKLTPAECYAHGYGCTKCTGELDVITPRATACLARMLQSNSQDATALALQSSLHANDYGWATHLAEPERSNPHLRGHYADKAVRAADRAEALSDGNDSLVYSALAHAYGVTCERDKLRNAVQQGLRINPDDPSLLGSMGNWLAFNGDWEDGAALVDRALEIEPQRFEKWWLYAPALGHYSRGEFEQAYDLFLTSFNERNWLTHVLLAYTLPRVGRIDEAREMVRKLETIYAGLTVEKVLHFHKRYCVEDRVLQMIKESLIEAGMPSRGNSDDFSNIIMPPVKVVKINGEPIEYLEMGTGEPVVFLHGAITDYRVWAQYEVPISDRFRFISYSLRYFGSQPWPQAKVEPKLQDYVKDLVAFIEHLDAGPVHLVSWSFSGRVASILAHDRPDLVKSAVHYEPVEDALIAGDTTISPGVVQAFQASFEPFIAQLKAGETEGAVMRFYEAVTEKESGSFAYESVGIQQLILDNKRSLSFFMNPELAAPMMTCEYLKKIRVPTLILKGAETNPVWSAMARNAAACTPGAKLVELAGVKHDGPVRSYKEMATLITEFVDQHSGIIASE